MRSRERILERGTECPVGKTGNVSVRESALEF